MRSRIPIRSSLSLSLSLLSLTLLTAEAQSPADEFFHGGAQRYLTNNIPGALEIVTNGLQRFPNDEKLKKLYELLNQKQRKQQQQKNQDQKPQDQDKKDEQQQQNDKRDQAGKNDQQKKEDEQKQKESQAKKDQQKKDPDQAKAGDKSKDKPEDKAGDSQPVAAHEMTPQEAKRLLDAQKGDEQVLIFQPQGEPKNRTKPLKDW